MQEGLYSQEPAFHLLPPAVPKRPISAEVNSVVIFLETSTLYGCKAELSHMDYFLERRVTVVQSVNHVAQ